MAVTTLVGIAATLAVAAPADAASYAPISGSGNVAGQAILDEWRMGTAAGSAQTIYYGSSGSEYGLTHFLQGHSDFAVTELPFAVAPDDGESEPPTRPSVYIPALGSAVSFTYNLSVDGVSVTDLQLSDTTVAGIFTGQITQWNDPAVTADNPHLALPDTPITPIVRADRSADTAYVTRWLSVMKPEVWTTGTTSLFPAAVLPHARALNGPMSVANYVAQSYGRGSITYVENAYLTQLGQPVARLRNASGVYAAPSTTGITTALAAARFDGSVSSAPVQNPNLDEVYTSASPDAYPLSSYYSFLAPTSVSGSFTASKGSNLAEFVRYTACAAQAHPTARGYAPLPASLTAAALAQIARIPGADPATCDVSPTPTTGDIGLEAEVLLGVDAGLSLSTPVDETTELSPATTVDGQSVSTGTLPTFSVVDARVVSRPGYTVQTAVTDFTSGTATIPASSLEITPRVDAAGLASGVVAAARFAASATATDFAYALDGAGVGTAVFGGDLTLTAPRGTPEGLYSARMTVTLVSR